MPNMDTFDLGPLTKLTAILADGTEVELTAPTMEEIAIEYETMDHYGFSSMARPSERVVVGKTIRFSGTAQEVVVREGKKTNPGFSLMAKRVGIRVIRFKNKEVCDGGE